MRDLYSVGTEETQQPCAPDARFLQPIIGSNQSSGFRISRLGKIVLRHWFYQRNLFACVLLELEQEVLEISPNMVRQG